MSTLRMSSEAAVLLSAKTASMSRCCLRATPASRSIITSVTNAAAPRHRYPNMGI